MAFGAPAAGGRPEVRAEPARALRPPGPRRGFPRVVLAVGLVAVAGVLAWLALGRAVSTGATTFRTAAVTRGDLAVVVTATGTIEPEEVVDVGAQIVGMIREFGRDPNRPDRPVDYGSVVDEGTVLARIDDTMYRAQRDQAQANLERARADLLALRATLRKTERDWTRARELLRRELIAVAVYDAALADYDSARSGLAVGEASVVQAEAALRQADINLGYTTIRSPVKGVVVDRRVNIGQTVVSSLNAPSLFLIAKDLTRIQVWASVNEADVGRIAPGQTVRFTVDAFPGETFVGEVAQVRLNATMTQNVVTYTVVVTVDNADGRLLPYLTTSLTFEVERRTGVLRAPNAALRWQPRSGQTTPEVWQSFVRESAAQAAQPDRGWVWVGDHGQARPVAVGVGLSDGITTEIVRGDLAEGQAVIVGERAEGAESESEASPFAPRFFGGGRR